MVVLYNAGSWKDVILTWTGSPMQNIWPTLLAWAVFVVACFFLLEVNHTTFGTEGHCMLGGTMSTLLIFRANAAYARFWKGRTLVTKFFTNMRDLMCYAFLYVKGGESTQSWRDGDYTTLVPEDENDLKAHICSCCPTVSAEALVFLEDSIGAVALSATMKQPLMFRSAKKNALNN
ncbi:unnamed protein product [Polarella glacialis]|uniref:Uncharacterized protein n=1 Tax=Polarella glacialis TaxID=89957 RepID=A0A813EW56_POLGL|nr:unnamed protein product [Polarella glacialis]